MSSDCAAVEVSGRRRASLRALPRPLVALSSRPELAGLVVLAGVLNLWSLSINGWANAYYSAAVRSLTTSWHDFWGSRHRCRWLSAPNARLSRAFGALRAGPEVVAGVPVLVVE